MRGHLLAAALALTLLITHARIHSVSLFLFDDGLFTVILRIRILWFILVTG